jgi:hypothetical protein
MNMLSCICLEPEEEVGLEQAIEIQTETDIAPPTALLIAHSSSSRKGPQEKERKKLRDKVTIFTGALGSKDECEDYEDYADSSGSDEDGFEYQADELFDPGEPLTD